MMKNKKFIILGILSLFILITPSMMVLTIVFPPLFFVLACLPTLFLYFTIFSISKFAVRYLGRIRWLLIPIPVVIIGLGVPYYYNMPTYEKIERLTKNDKNISEPILKGDTIGLALYSTRGSSQNNDCMGLCQILLFNGVFKNVIVETSQRDMNYKFFIQKKERCPIVSNVIDVFATRIAMGECLLSKEASIEEADYIYKEELISYPSRYIKSIFKIDTVEAKRVQVIDKIKGIIHQTTAIKAKPLAYPFYIGPFGGYKLRISTVIGRSEIVINDLEKIFRDEDKKVFGDAIKIKIPENFKKNKMQLIWDAIRDNGKDKLAGHKLFGEYIESTYKEKKAPTEDDIRLVIAALKDDRIDQWSSLTRFIKRLDNIPEELIQELANRIIRKRSYETSKAIYDLPSGMAVSIYPQLVQIIEDKELRAKAWLALIRLSDGGSKSVEKYINLLTEYHSLLKGRDYKSRNNYVKTMGNVGIASLISLCHLGKTALPAKDVLFLFVIDKSRGGSLSKLAIDALIQMDMIEELQQEFGEYKYLWEEIQREIQYKARTEEAGQGFCKKYN